MTFFQNGTINSCTEENVVISYLFFIPKVSFETNLGFQNLAKRTAVLNAEEWATVSNRAYAAAGLAGLEIAKDPTSLEAV